MAILLRGKELAQRIKEDLKAQVVDLKARFSRPILLCAISVGEDSASLSYMRSQRKTAEFLGIDYKIEQLSEETTESELIDFIEALNQDSAISGIILQMPLPSSIDAKKVLEHINPLKDVEGVHPQNMGRLFLGDFRIVPPTALSAFELIKSLKIDLVGKSAVVIGRSNIVGKPISMLLLSEHCTVCMCHSRTKNLKAVAASADILVVAIGRPKFIGSEYIKEGAIVIDVGTNQTDAGLVGDVDFDGVVSKAYAITPVPGGVGPLTVCMLMRNTIESFKLHNV